MSSRIPYERDPDFSRPLLEIPVEARERMRARLEFLYGDAPADEWLPELERILARSVRNLVNKRLDYKCVGRVRRRAP